MKKVLKRTLSVVLALIMLLSVMSPCFFSFAEESEQIAVPEIQTLLTDGKALEKYVESAFLNLKKGDELLVENLDSLSASLCELLGSSLFYIMGYNEQQYPNDTDSLLLALARAIGTLDAEYFREPDKIVTTDMSLVYNLAYIGGTDYIQKINASLPKELRFDLSEPVLALDEEQKSEISDYYARYKAGELKLDDFDIKNYLGELAPEQYFKAVLLVFIADDERLPAITEKAIDFDFTAERKAAVCTAVARLLDDLKTAPVSALIGILSDPDFQAVLKPLIETANKVTIDTSAYSYRLFNEGIFTDVDGSAIDGIVDNGDGTYSYMGASLISDYLGAVDKVLELFSGIDKDLENGVLKTILKTRLPIVKELVISALDIVAGVLTSQSSAISNDIACAEIEKRFAEKQIAKIDSGEHRQQLINAAQSELDEISDEIALIQAELLELEKEELRAKENVRGYYDTLAELEALINEENEEEITSSEEYITAKSKVDETEASLSDNYSRQSALSKEIASKVEKSDELANEIYRLNNEYYPADAKAVYTKMLSEANSFISEKTAELNALPDNELTNNVYLTVKSLVSALVNALDGVYDKIIDESPLSGAATFVLGLKDFADAVENIDWDSISEVTAPLFEQIDLSINNSIGRYIGVNGGANILADLDSFINEFLESYGVYNYIKLDYLDTFLSTEILGDNSEVMTMAANALSGFFGEVEPTYESIVSCLIPILSAFDSAGIMANKDNIADSLSYASPSAFAYLAGLSSSDLESGYFARVNESLVQNGYRGSAVAPILNLDSSKASRLLSFVSMEKNEYSLSDIAAAGFNWKEYTVGANKLEVANALIKIALGDSDKLGEIASAPGLGSALVNLLCDLFDDLRDSPARTILKKISATDDLAAIINLAMTLFNGYDTTYMSYDMYFEKTIIRNPDGTEAFYVYVNNEGETAYKGPRAINYFVPVIGAALNLLDGIYDDVLKNDGDLLKTVLYDKIPLLKELIKSAISYTDESGEMQAGAVFYLLLGYGDYLKSENALMCYDLLISLTNASVDKLQLRIGEMEALIGLWEGYLEQAKSAEDAAKLTEAVKQGVFDDSVTTFDEGALDAAIEAKTAALQAELATLEAKVLADEQAVQQAQDDVDALQAEYDEYSAKIDAMIDNSDFIDTLVAILAEQDLSYLDDLRAACEDWFNGLFGAGKYDELAALIIDNYASYYYYDSDADENVPLIDEFIEDIILGDSGMNLAEKLDQLDTELSEAKDEETGWVAVANAQLATDTAAKTSKANELDKYSSGAVKSAIMAADDNVKITISDNELDIDGDFSSSQIEDAINKINNVDIASINADILAEEGKREEYYSAKEEIEANKPSFNVALVPLAAEASEALTQGIVDILTGNKADGSENVYNYIINKDIVNILTTGGRLASLFKAIVGIYAPALRALVSEGLLSPDTASQLINAIPSFEKLYNETLEQFPDKFKLNPVGALGEVINEVCSEILAEFVQADSELTHDVLQIKKINRDIIAIFDEDFGSDWADSYSKCIVMRTGEIYQLIADLLGFSFVKDVIGQRTDTKGSLSGNIDTSMLFADATVSLYKADVEIASCTVAKDSDGSFEFTGIEEGSYVLKLSTHASVPIEIKAVDIIGEETTDLTKHSSDEIISLVIPVGDTNGDNVVDIEDVAIILDSDNYGSDNEACDINCDGLTDIADISLILAEGNYTAQQEFLVY